MANGEVNETTTGPAAAPETQTPAYAPPAVAWEEEFEPLAQATQTEPGCGYGPTCP